MNTLLVISISTALIGCCFAVQLLLKTAKSNTDRALAAVFSIMAIGGVDVLLTTTLPLWSENLSGVSYPIFIFLGPFLVLHLKALSGETKAETSIFQQLSRTSWLYFALSSLIFSVAYGMHVAGRKSDLLFFIAAIMGLSISAWTAFHIYKGIELSRLHDLRLKDWFSRVDDKSFNWMRHVLTLPIAIIVIDFLSLFLGELTSAQSLLRSINTIVLCAVVTVFAYKAILNRAIYPSIDQISPQEISTKVSYSNSGLSKERLERLLKKLDKLMEKEKPYLDPNISLPKIAVALGSSTNHLSQALNQGREQTFLDFINKHRVYEAQRLMRASSENLLHIALASGFNSRSTFNTAFRKHCGMTPSKFRQGLSNKEFHKINVSEPIG